MQQRFTAMFRGQFDQLYGLRSFALQQAASADGQKKTDLAHAYSAMATLLDLDLTVYARRPGERFFGPTDKFDDTVNFLVWRQQADKLGVRLTNDDINQMIADETRGEFTKEA